VISVVGVRTGLFRPVRSRAGQRSDHRMSPGSRHSARSSRHYRRVHLGRGGHGRRARAPARSRHRAV